MRKYGNILILLNSGDRHIFQVKTLLDSNGMDYENVENIFCLQTRSKPQTYRTIEELNSLGLEYVYFLNNRASGSALITSGLEDEVTQRLKKIILGNPQ